MSAWDKRLAPRPPAPVQLLERCWRMRSVETGRFLDCGIYQTADGLELRAGYNPSDLLYKKVIDTLEHGRGVAADLRMTVLSTKQFETLPDSVGA